MRRRKVAAISQSGDYVVIEEVIVIVMVVAYVEKAVALEAHRLMDFKIQRNCFHNMYGVTLWSGCYIYVISIMSLSAARLPSENFVINIYHLAPGLVPSDLRHFLDALVAQIGMHRRIRNYGINGIGHGIYVPVVGLDDIV